MAKANETTRNILIVGVGGQGVILASDILSAAAMKSGYDVKKSEVHGMAQRGGIVSSHVRYGLQLYSPLIPRGKVHVLVAFELAEAARWISFLSPLGRVVVSRQKLIPPIVSTGKAKYPDDAEDILKRFTCEPILVDALVMAEQLGNARLVNTILLGVTSRLLDLPLRTWRSVLLERVPSAFRALNLKAFDMGRDEL